MYQKAESQNNKCKKYETIQQTTCTGLSNYNITSSKLPAIRRVCTKFYVNDKTSPFNIQNPVIVNLKFQLNY